MKPNFTIGIGGAAGQGVATPDDLFAKIFSSPGILRPVNEADQVAVVEVTKPVYFIHRRYGIP